MNPESGLSYTWASLIKAARLLKVLGHPARLQILNFIEGSEESVSAIQRHVGLTQAMTSQHLKVMHAAKLIQRRRQGTSVFYRITPDRGAKMLECLRKCEELWQDIPVEHPDY